MSGNCDHTSLQLTESKSAEMSLSDVLHGSNAGNKLKYLYSIRFHSLGMEVLRHHKRTLPQPNITLKDPYLQLWRAFALSVLPSAS